MNKNILLWTTCVLFTVYGDLWAQVLEDPTSATLPTEIENQDTYYQQLLEAVDGDLTLLKGSGYLPYQRDRYFYEQRRKADGSTYLDERWELFKTLRSEANRMSGPSANWTSIGPTDMDGHGGRMISHAFDPLMADVVWAGSASGGLWLSENAGASWTPMTDAIPSTGVGAIAVNPTDGDMLIIGTGEGYSPPSIAIKGGIGTFRSIDRGQTWLPTSFSYSMSAGVSVLKLAWHPTDVNIVWMAASNGLWKSEDMGQTWNAILSDGTNHQNFIFDDIIIQEDNPNIMFVSHENVGVLKSTDGGNTFNLLDNGIPTTDVNFISIDQCKTQPNVLYASVTRLSTVGLHGVYKSIDNGDSWTQLSSAPDA
ncbi:MAG: hypothetical protein AAFP76_15250, partial [Bacteroidota bacterium]